jgi:hypothetical protein
LLPKADAASGDALAAQKQSAALALSEFQRQLKQTLMAAGIDTGQPIHLEVDGNGGVNVGGDHPQRSQIQELFEKHPDLAEKFTALARQYGDLRAAESGGSPLIPPTFSLMLQDDKAQVAFR